MLLSRFDPRRTAAMGALVLLVGGMLGCAPAPEPTPTPAFASEEEAFAAAEEVYRAYMLAFNEVDIEDPSTFETLSGFTAGEYLSDEREQLSVMHAEGYRRGGDIEIVRFIGTTFSENSVEARVCNDVSATTFTDANGKDLVPPDRAQRSSLELTFRMINADLKLVTATASEDDVCAGG